MEIMTQRLRLVPVSLEHVESTFEYASDIENTKYMMYLPFGSLEETRQSIVDAINEWNSSAPKRLEFAVMMGDAHIGGLTLYYLEDRTHGELGWVMNKAYWGRGYITEAAQGLMYYAAKELGISRIIACCDSENMASRRVMEKLGMKFYGTGKRKNRSMGDEERIEIIYEVFI